jgi:GNAT superfamily N-acetyltransferase
MLADKGLDLLHKSGIFPTHGSRDVAIVEVDSTKPKHVIGALTYTAKEMRDGALVLSFDLAVDPGHQGKGVGRTLIDGALSVMSKHLAFVTNKRVLVEVNVINEVLLAPLRRRGFTVREGSWDEEWYATKVLR